MEQCVDFSGDHVHTLAHHAVCPIRVIKHTGIAGPQFLKLPAGALRRKTERSPQMPLESIAASQTLFCNNKYTSLRMQLSAAVLQHHWPLSLRDIVGALHPHPRLAQACKRVSRIES